MDAPELRLRCLELAMEQAKRESRHCDREEVARIAKEFYDQVVGDNPTQAKSDTTSTRKPGRPRGQGAEIFE